MSNFNTSIIRNATIHWAKLDTPVSPFGGDMAYEAQFRVAKSRKKELDALNIRYKEVEGKLAMNLKRYAHNSKGVATPVTVVDEAKNSTRTDNIGNGSKVNFKVFQYESKRGLVTRLMAVQITKLEEYAKDNTDFDVEGGEAADF